MPILRQFMVDVDVTPFVEEAIAALGFVRTKFSAWLAEKVAEHASQNHGRSIREEQPRLSVEDRLACGLPKYGDGHISVAVWNALTDKGRVDPVRSFDDTVARALMNATRAADRVATARTMKTGLFVAVQIGPAADVDICGAGNALRGAILSKPPELPLPGCDRRVCYCNWRSLTPEQVTAAQAKGLA